LANATCCGVGLAAIPLAPPLKPTLDVLLTTTVLLYTLVTATLLMLLTVLL
jgi:hypothetical protein